MTEHRPNGIETILQGVQREHPDGETEMEDVEPEVGVQSPDTIKIPRVCYARLVL